MRGGYNPRLRIGSVLGKILVIVIGIVVVWLFKE